MFKTEEIAITAIPLTAAKSWIRAGYEDGEKSDSMHSKGSKAGKRATLSPRNVGTKFEDG